MKIIITFFTTIFLFTGFEGFSQQLKYQPVNPNFGGNYLNYNWLLASANAQDPFKEENKFGMDNGLLSGFSDSVKRQILNQLSRELLNDGKNLGEPGTYESGGLIINVGNTRTGTIITIIDPETGEYTEIIL